MRKYHLPSVDKCRKGRLALPVLEGFRHVVNLDDVEVCLPERYTPRSMTFLDVVGIEPATLNVVDP